MFDAQSFLKNFLKIKKQNQPFFEQPSTGKWQRSKHRTRRPIKKWLRQVEENFFLSLNSFGELIHVNFNIPNTSLTKGLGSCIFYRNVACICALTKEARLEDFRRK